MGTLSSLHLILFVILLSLGHGRMAATAVFGCVCQNWTAPCSESRGYLEDNLSVTILSVKSSTIFLIFIVIFHKFPYHFLSDFQTPKIYVMLLQESGGSLQQPCLSLVFSYIIKLLENHRFLHKRSFYHNIGKGG